MKRLARGLILATLTWSGAARGNGFNVAEEGAAATGMVGAFTAKADDATAIFYNPAGIARLRGPQFYLGGMLIVGASQAHGTPALALPGGNQDSNTAVVFLPNIYLVHGLPRDFAIGVGIFTNFGLKNTWPTDWAGRALSTYANLETITVNPTLAWRPVSWFSIGVGFDVTPARVELKRAQPLVDAEATLRFRANAAGFGGNVGVLFETQREGRFPPINFGVSYRSRYDLDFNGGALRADNVPIELSAVLHDTVATTTLTIPDIISTGFGVRPVDKLFLQVQFDWTHWSRLQTIQLTTEDPALNVTLPQRWSDGYALRFGGEYAWDKVSLRLGFGFDWTPAPANTLSPIIPDANRYLVSGGVGIPLPRGFKIEGSLMAVLFEGRTSTLPEFPVRYETFAVLMSAGVSYARPSEKQAQTK